jgi:hypothetical protein
MSGHSQQTSRAIADRDRGHARLRTVTATAGVLGVVAAGAVAFALPGAQHTTSGSSGSTGTAGSTGTSGSSAADATGSSSAGSSSAGSSLSPASTAPSASSGSGSVTSGGS